MRSTAQKRGGNSLPTSGAAVAPTAPSKERSNAYTAERSCSGTISANIALLLVPDLPNPTPMAHQHSNKKKNLQKCFFRHHYAKTESTRQTKTSRQEKNATTSVS